MRTRIKFCGLARPEDVAIAVRLGVDAIGFVFYPRSPRFLTVEAAAALRRGLPSWVSAVGLFVNAPAEAVLGTARQVGLDVLQFHGDESAEQAQGLADAVARPWWRAVRMKGETDLLSSAETFEGAEALLLDAYSEGFGGSGHRFDWSWIPKGVSRPLILSGGLDAENVAEAIARVQPFAVDVSSGIQGPDPRQKDADRMERFVAAVLTADAKRA